MPFLGLEKRKIAQMGIEGRFQPLWALFRDYRYVMPF
jgi:hypothetical protein